MPSWYAQNALLFWVTPHIPDTNLLTSRASQVFLVAAGNVRGCSVLWEGLSLCVAVYATVVGLTLDSFWNQDILGESLGDASWDQLLERSIRRLADATLVVWFLIVLIYAGMVCRSIYVRCRRADDSEQQLECFGWLQWLLDWLPIHVCQVLGEDYRRMHFPAILMSAWFMALLVNTMWAVLFVWGGLELPRYALDNAEGPLRQLHAFLQERLNKYSPPALLAMEATAGRVCPSRAAQHAQHFLEMFNFTATEQVLGTFNTTIVQNWQIVRYVINEGIPETLALIPAVARGAGCGLVAGACVGAYLTLTGIIATWRTYADLYDYFWINGAAQLRFPIRRSDSVRIFSCVVANAIVGMWLIALTLASVGALIAMVVVDWPLVAPLRNALLNAAGSVLFYLLVVESIIAPLARHFRLGSVLFAIEVWNLRVTLLKASTRMTYAIMFMFTSFFTPASCALGDGLEYWEFGHISFAAFVMERVTEDRRQANVISKLLKGLKERETAAGADVENTESSRRNSRESLKSYSSHQSLRSLRASVVSSRRGSKAEPTTGPPLVAESRLFEGASPCE